MGYDGDRVQSFLRKFIAACHAQLAAALASIHDQAPVSYLRARGLAERPLLERFDVGYFEELPMHGTTSPMVADLEREYSDILPFLTKHSHARQSLDSAGRGAIPCIYGPAGNFLFRRRLIFPIYGIDGSVLNVYGRTIEEDSPFKHLYGSARWNWYNIGRPEIASAKALVLTESIVDALTFVHCGIPTVTSLCAGPYRYGPNIAHDQRVEFMNAGLVEQLKEQTGVHTIYICFDKDANFAGDIQAVSLAKILAESGFDVKLLHLPPNEDPNSLFTKSGDTQSQRRARFLDYFTDMMGGAGDFIMEEALLELERLNLNQVQMRAVRQLLAAVGQYYSRSDERLFDVTVERRADVRDAPRERE
ncbi:MAG: toprim domain-containing protein [Deltaproteobacteria bacterium]|nr:toprim domain-containing protein [Deltaproteobacteria bacterium]